MPRPRPEAGCPPSRCCARATRAAGGRSGAVLEQRPRWAAGDFWAPELVRRDGRVLAYYAARGRSGRRCVAVASSARLRGPYRDEGPLVCSGVGDIDPLPVTDEHGAHWLVWKKDGNSRGRPTPILAAPLAPGGLALAGVPRELFRADAPWERGLVEAPALLRRDGMFYLLYSAGRCCGRTLQLRDRRGALALAAGAMGEATRRRSWTTTRVPLPGPRERGRRAGWRPAARLPRLRAQRPGEPAAADRTARIRRRGLAGRGCAGAPGRERRRPCASTSRARGSARAGSGPWGCARRRGGGGALELGTGVLAQQARTATFSARTVVTGGGAERAPAWR